MFQDFTKFSVTASRMFQDKNTNTTFIIQNLSNLSSSPPSSIRNKQIQHLSCCFVISASLSQLSIILNVKCLFLKKFQPVGLTPVLSVCLWSTPPAWWWRCPCWIQYFPSRPSSTSTTGYSSPSRRGKDYSDNWLTDRWEFQLSISRNNNLETGDNLVQGKRFERSQGSGLVGVRLHCLSRPQVLSLHHWTPHSILLRYKRYKL